MRQPWTDAETRYLVNHYATDTLHAIAAHLGRPFESVQIKSYALQKAGLVSKHKRAYNPPWSEDDEDYLNDNFGRLSDETIARHLKRPIWGVRLKAKRIGICRR